MRVLRACLFAASAVAVTSMALAQAPASATWAEAMTRLERAALDGATKELRTLRADFAQRLTASPQSVDESQIRYALAYSGWRMANLPDVPDNERAQLLDDAVSQLQQAVKRNAKDAEALALLGSVYGLQIAASPIIRGMTLGPRASGSLDRAAEIDGGNPRVILLQGVGAFNTPAMFGGGVEKAERLLRRSLERFATEAADKPWPNWGRFDAHVWLGQALLDKGDKAGARAEYDKARALAPNSGWLRYVLMPALDAKR